MNKNILDSIWIWCHSAGCYNNLWNIPGKSGFTPVEAAAYLGIKNAIMVVFCGAPQPPFDDFALQFSRMDKVVWSIIGDSGSKRNNMESDLKPVVNLRGKLPNLQGGIMDDFFGNERANIDKVKDFADKLHAAGLELWVVLYGHQMETPLLQDYLNICDVINFWTWRAEELPLLEKRLEKLRIMVPNKKIALGCYMWDFGDSKPISIQAMEYQCGLAVEKWRDGLISDIVMLGSPLCGMEIEAVEWTRAWIKKVGGEKL